MEIIRTRILPGAVIVDLVDTVDRGRNEIAGAITQLLKQGHRTFVFNLERVSILDSAGLGDIVRAFVIVRRSGGSLRLEGLNPRLEEELGRFKLGRSWEVNPLPDPSHPLLRDINRKIALAAAGIVFLWLVIMTVWRWAGL
jgi:anti-sigma B factor antagonist